MRILNLMWGFNIGGIGKCFLMYNQLGKESDDLEVVTACINLQNVAFDLAPLHKINATIINIKNRRDLSWLPKCRDLIAQVKPDLIFTHGFNGPVVVATLKWRYKFTLPFVCSYHGEYHAPSMSRKLVEPIFNKTMHYLFQHKAAGVTCVCEHSKRFLMSHGISPTKITTIHNGLKRNQLPEKKDILRHDLNIAETSLIIGTASRIDPVKGLEFLLEALANLLFEGNDVDLILVGDGHSVSDLKLKVNQLQITDRVHFVGFQEDMSPWFSLFDIFALPSRAEYHSIGLLEAMRSQKAIVATDVGGNTESVRHEKEALIVPAADASALQMALHRLITSSNLRHNLAKAAKLRFQNKFTEDITKENLTNWLLSFSQKQ